MKNGFKKFTVVLVVILALALGVGAVSAQGPDDANRPERDRHPVSALSLVRTLADEAGVTAAELVEAWEDEMTLADLAASFEVSTGDLLAAATANASARIDEALANERITQEQADELLANMETAFEEALATTRPERLDGDGPLAGVRDRFDGDVVRGIIDALGLTPREIAAQLQDGMTLNEIAEAQGVDLDVIVDEVMAAATERIDEAVANERITQEQADELLSNLEERINDVLENGLPLRESGFGGRRGGERPGGLFSGQPPAGQPPAEAAPAGSSL